MACGPTCGLCACFRRMYDCALSCLGMANTISFVCLVRAHSRTFGGQPWAPLVHGFELAVLPGMDVRNPSCALSVWGGPMTAYFGHNGELGAPSGKLGMAWVSVVGLDFPDLTGRIWYGLFEVELGFDDDTSLKLRDTYDDASGEINATR
eukprot:scaffold1381_cov386-Prasinococcus_capsulatus_cf.AAC.13